MVSETSSSTGGPYGAYRNETLRTSIPPVRTPGGRLADDTSGGCASTGLSWSNIGSTETTEVSAPVSCVMAASCTENATTKVRNDSTDSRPFAGPLRTASRSSVHSGTYPALNTVIAACSRRTRRWRTWLISAFSNSTSLRCQCSWRSPTAATTAALTAPRTADSSASSGSIHSCSATLTAPSSRACTTTATTPASVSRIRVIPNARLASSPTVYRLKNVVGCRNSRSQIPACKVASKRPSMRSNARFSTAANAIDTSAATATATHAWTTIAASPPGTYLPSTLPVTTGTSSPNATAPPPLNAIRHRSRRAPRRP